MEYLFDRLSERFLLAPAGDAPGAAAKESDQSFRIKDGNAFLDRIDQIFGQCRRQGLVRRLFTG